MRLAEHSFCRVIELNGPNGEPLVDAHGQRVKQREVSVEPPEILREFEKKWRLGSWYPLEHIFEEASKFWCPPTTLQVATLTSPT